MWSIGIIMGYFIARHVIGVLKLPVHRLGLAVQYVFVGGLIGARLAQVIFYMPEYYIQNPIKIFYVWEGGLASHGGMAGAVAGLWLFCRKYPDYPFLLAVEIGVISFFLFAGLVRIGNLINGEIPGKPTLAPWAFIFHDYIPRHPVVLYEAILYFTMQGALLLLFHIVKDKLPGIYLSSSMVVGFTGRFLIEFFKEPEVGIYFNAISHTQMLSFPFIVLGIYFMITTLQGRWTYGNVVRISA